MWTTLLSSFGGDGDDAEDSDPLEILTSDQHDHTDEPDARLQQQQTMTLIEAALQKLPARQREAFLMRYWEDMDVAETAAAMGCSQGSVKTHCSRAVHALAKILGEHGLSDVMKKKGVEDEA